MSIANIIDQALQQDVLLYLNDKGELAYKAANGLSEQLKSLIIGNKAEIIVHLSQLSRSRNESSIQLPALKKSSDKSVGILSRAQQRLLFIDQQNEGSAEYNIQGVFEIKGQFNRKAFYSTIDSIIERHHILSTNYKVDNGEVTSKLNLQSTSPIIEKELDTVGNGTVITEVDRIIQLDREKAFDLANDCLLRVTLIGVSEEHQLVIFNMHHIASDGWSVGVIKQEFNQLYAAYCKDEGSPLQDLIYQYTDYAAWQSDLLSGHLYSEGLLYWKQQLANVSPYLDFPLDKKRPNTLSHKSVSSKTLINKETLDTLEKLCQTHNVTLFMLLQTAFSVLLGRFCNSSDIVIGTPVSGRDKSELESLIGLFINTVVLRTDLSNTNQSFVGLLSQSRSVILDAFANQYIPFEDIVGELKHTRSANINPVFQTWFVLQNNEKVDLELENCRIEAYPLESSTAAKYDLNLYATQSGQGLSLDWVLSHDLFEQTTVDYLAREFKQFIVDIARNPTNNISSYSIFANRVENLPNENSIELEHNLLELFEQQAQSHPNKVAVVSDEKQVTYAELNHLSECYADRLRTLEDIRRVALIQQKGIGVIVAMWACLKADKVFVPIDNEYPIARVHAILEDAQIDLVFTDLGNQALVEQIKQDFNIESWLIEIDSNAKLTDSKGRPSENQLSLGHAVNNLSEAGYILYTSGSTGKPKGVVQNLAGLTYHAKSYADVMSLTREDQVLQLASFSYDASIPDMFGSLISGATLFLIEIKQFQPEQLISKIKDYGITVYHSTATVFKTIFDRYSDNKIPALRRVVMGGEVVGPEVISLFSRVTLETAELVNLYGATESTLISVQPVSRKDSIVVLGRPVPGMNIHVVNKDHAKCRTYEIGEITVESAFVAQGYWKNKELTSERFVDLGNSDLRSPKSLYLNKTLPIKQYRTGDLGYICSQGNLHWVGRKDHQIKFNGIRVEPSEIEQLIAQLDKVNSVAVVQHDNQSLVAFFTATHQQISVEHWRSELTTHLPDFMVPGQFVQLEELPLTVSGKINRMALGNLEIKRQTSKAFVAPSNEWEQQLHSLWCHQFSLDSISIDDTFFELGGHSIAAMNLLALVSKEFNASVSLKDFFVNPTIRALATLVQTAEPSLSSELSELLEENPAHRYEPFELNNIQHAYWLGRAGIFELGDVSTQSYLEFDIAQLDKALFEQAVNRTIERHDMLRMVLHSDGMQRILEATPYYKLNQYSTLNASEQQQEEHFNHIRNDMFKGMQTLEQWPNFDIRLTQLTEDLTRVHLCTDAIYMDARSKQIFLQEIAAIYSDSDIQLPELGVTFRDYVNAEEKLKETKLYRNAKSYWLERIKTLPASPELPLSNLLSEAKAPEFNQRTIEFSKAQWQQLQSVAQSHQLTVTNLLLAAYSDVLALWSKSKHFTINVTAFNRLPLHQDIQNVIGDFTSSSLLEVDHNHVLTFQDRATNIQNQLLNDLEHRYFTGIEVIRETSTLKGSRVLMPVVFTSLIGMQSSSSEFKQHPLYSEIIQSIRSYSQTSQVLLDCQIIEESDGAKINWNSVDELFPENLVQQMFECFERCVQQAATEDNYWINTHINLLPPPQQQRRRSVNNTRVERKSQLLHQPFERMLEHFANKTAIINGSTEISYQQLEWMSNAIAGELKQQQVKPNDLVAVVMEKGWEQIVAVLAILKAGAAYLPVDANLPSQRVETLLDIGEVKVVLSQQHTGAAGKVSQSISNIEIGPELLNISPHEPVDAVQSESDLAYVIFTSGSTGMPKGVMIDHRGAVNTIEDINCRFSVSHTDTVLALSALNFDLSVYDIFGVLGVGGTVVLPLASAVNDAEIWSELVNRHQVTLWNSVPALIQMWLDTVEDRKQTISASLRTVMMSGDWIPLDLPTRIKKWFDGIEVFSLGGATEASIWSIFYSIDQVDSNWSSIPYGKPMENQTFNVLKSDLSECPEHVVGDLYIGGIGLAKGYFKDKEKTANSFIVHPQTGEPLYRTGDMGRYLSDGNIEFLGREDSQVKVNGYRIELGEIESVIMQHPLVKHVVVHAFGEKFDKKLVSYLELIDEITAFEETKEAVIQLIDSSLPHYMMPVEFIAIDHIPLTANGKVNRTELPEPSFSSETETKMVPPSNETERVLCGLWSNALGKSIDNVESDFFLAGGDSLQAARVISAIRNEFNLDSSKFQITTFFETPTIKAIANNIIAYKQVEMMSNEMLDLAETDEDFEEGMI